MFRGLLSNRLIQVGLVFFVVVVSGSLLYSWQTRRATVAEFIQTDAVLHEARSEQNTVNTSPVDFKQSETPLEQDDSQMAGDTNVSPTDETSEVLEMADAFLPNGLVSEEAIAEDIPVSPYGFGPYPEVPGDFFGIPIWEKRIPDLPVDIGKNVELIDRVLIQLWQQGDKNIIGGFLQNGKVYPNYPETVYVKEHIEKSDDGLVERHFSDIAGPPGTRIYHEDLWRGNIPPHVTIIPMDDSQGIDPYSFLNLGEFSQ
ncbi:hypothetical protein J5I95_06090 [Candidatus Poribacteria bacterium]|nr:hypothetical protein [Candidatus Poribacteria bacterium]